MSLILIKIGEVILLKRRQPKKQAVPVQPVQKQPTKGPQSRQSPDASKQNEKTRTLTRAAWTRKLTKISRSSRRVMNKCDTHMIKNRNKFPG